MRTSTLTVLFADMVGSSRRMSELGDDRGDAFMATFVWTLDDVVSRFGGRTIKHLGDGVMAVFDRSSLDAIRASRSMHVEAARLSPDEPPLVRVGISLGEVTRHSGDYYGRTVVEASRLCDAAVAGTTLVSPQLRSAIGDRDGISFDDVGPLELKGLPEPMVAGRLVRSDEPDEPTPGSEPATRRRRRHRRHRRHRRPAGTRTAPRSRRITAVATSITIVVATAVGIGVAVSSDGGGVGTAASGSVAMAPTDYTPRLTPTACAEGTGSDVTCSILRVPEDRARPTGAAVEVPVDEFAATSAIAPDAPPIIQIGGFETLETSTLRAHHRVIRLGERGVVGTPTLSCPEIVVAGNSNLLRPIRAPESDAAMLDAIAACHDRWTATGVDVAAFDDDDIALDLRDLVIALELDRIDLSADSTRSAVAFSALSRFPGNIRSVMLQNPVPTDVSPGDFTGSFAAAFGRLSALCTLQPRCLARAADMDGSWATAYGRLQAEPQMVTGMLPDGTAGSVLLDGDRASAALFTATGFRHLQVFIPDLLSKPNMGEIAYNAREKSYITDQPYGAELSDLCQRVEPNREPLDGGIDARLPQFRSSAYRLVPGACDRWKVPAGAPGFYRTTRSDVPLLIVHGELSPGTDIDWVERVAKSFTTVTTIRFPTLGFAVTNQAPKCLGDLREQFLGAPTDAIDATTVRTCVESTPPIPFLVG